MSPFGTVFASEGTPEEIPLDYFAGTEITIANRCSSADMYMADHMQKAAAKMIEEDLGIKVNWIGVDASEWTQKSATMMAGDMPDMLISMVDPDQITENLEMFYDLSQDNLMRTYAPYVAQQYDETVGNLAWKSVTWPDGSQRALLTSEENSVTRGCGAIMYINQKWLDKLDLAMPTNTEELYDVLVAFRDNDMNDDGDPSNEVPMLLGTSWPDLFCTSMMGLFGLENWDDTNLTAAYAIKDGVVYSQYDTQQFRDCLEYTHRLMSEGLIPADAFSMTAEQVGNYKNAGLVGVKMNGTHPGGSDWEDFVPLTSVCAYEDDKYNNAGAKDTFTGRKWCTISADTENVEACLWVWNYLTQPHVRAVSCMGEEGFLWEYDEDGKIKNVSRAKEEYPTDIPYGNYGASVALWNVGTTPYLSWKTLQESYFLDYSYGKDGYYADLVFDYITDMAPPARSYVTYPHIMEYKTDIEIEFKPYIDNFIAKSVMEGVTDESWEAHLKQLEVVQYPEYIEWYQHYVNEDFTEDTY